MLAPEAGDNPAGSVGHGKLWGPGALDGKGGLAVLLSALVGFEAYRRLKLSAGKLLSCPMKRSVRPAPRPFSRRLPDGASIGLLFEPALPDGVLVGSRFGSGNFVLSVHGQAAHAGRDPGAGSNAIHALAEFIVALKKMDQQDPLIHVNTGSVEGGGPVNVVPDFALCRFNIRAATEHAIATTQQRLTDMVDRINATKGISVELCGKFRRRPKPLDDRTRHILTSLADCGQDLGLDIRWRETAGVCDGNTLAAAGLANVDSLGPVGDGMHTAKEYVLIESIVERARLTALYLMKVASGEIALP